ncbi:MAG: transporter substrate-binding domain-containing protein [Rhodospirillaceae bacterium]|nr:transporter substrate-binding domain-containing protein [Rhodospirillaceae bacterium]
MSAAMALACSQIAHAEERPVILACNDFPPLKIESPGADGLRGSDIESIGEIAQRSGLKLETRFMPWNRGYALASDGAIDGLCSCSFRADRAELFYFSDPIGETSVGIFHPPGEVPEPIASVADLANPGIGVVGVVKGYNLDAELSDAKVRHLSVSGDQQAFVMLVNHRIDHLYSFRAPIDFIHRATGETGIAYTELRSSPYFICLSKKVDGAIGKIGRINDAIAEMRQDGAFDRIQRRYGQKPVN